MSIGRKIYMHPKHFYLIMQSTITIPRKEYQRLKALEKVEWAVVGEFKQALKDLKEGKFIKC